MDDPRGGLLYTSEHEVKTLTKALEWYELTIESELPLRVIQQTTSNGRVHLRVFDKDNNLIHMRG